MKGYKMKINIVEKGTQTLKDGSSYDYLKGLATVQKFGKPSLELITVKVNQPLSKYSLGEVDLNIMLPHSDYAYNLE